jgi:ketosteroid isomerase-like protein
MSEHDVDLFRRAWAAWGSGDLTAYFELCSDDFEWDLSGVPMADGGRVFAGKEAVAAWLVQWRETFDSYEAEALEFRDLGGGKVLALGRQRGRIKGSTAEVGLDWAQIATIRDGRIVRTENFQQEADALASLDEPPAA